MTFVDFLAFQEALLLIAAVVLGYVGVASLLAMRRNDVAGVKSALKGSSIPVGSLGGISAALALWGEFAWPLPGSYNILFTDVFLLFGMTLLILAVSTATSSKLQYAGIFALVAGGITIAYGWNGYVLGMTKEPFQTFLLYGAFGMTGVLAFPASLITDHYLTHPESSAFAAPAAWASARARPSFQSASRGVQPVSPMDGSAVAPTSEAPVRMFRLPIYMSSTLLVFVAFAALAGIAALFYLDSTLPAHLAHAP